MKKTAFTLMEVLVAMSIIGVVAAATVNSIKSVTANKTKLAFKNGYNHIVQTVATMASDFPDIPLDGTNDGTGHPLKCSMCEYDYPFAHEFILTHSKFTKIHHQIENLGALPFVGAFETAGGAYWIVWKNPRNACERPAPEQMAQSKEADYFIMFDVNGPFEGTNCPYQVLKPLDTGIDCENPDTFKFGIARNNTVVPDNSAKVYRGQFLEIYMLQMLKENLR